MFTTNPELAEELMGHDFAEAFEGPEARLRPRRPRPATRPTRSADPDPPELTLRPPWSLIAAPSPRRHAASCRPTRASRSTRPAASVPSGGSPMLEIGSYCGKSAVYLGAGGRGARHHPVRPRPPSRQRGEPGRAGSGTSPTWSTPRSARMDTLPRFRRTIHDAGLEASVVAAGRRLAHRRAGTGPSRCRCCSSTAVTAPSRPIATTRPGRPTSSRAACWPSTTCSPTRPTAAGRPTRSTAGPSTSGAFAEVRAVGSLRVLRRGRPRHLTPPRLECAAGRDRWADRGGGSASLAGQQPPQSARASTPPTRGKTMNTQSWLSAQPPS